MVTSGKCRKSMRPARSAATTWRGAALAAPPTPCGQRAGTEWATKAASMAVSATVKPFEAGFNRVGETTAGLLAFGQRRILIRAL